MAGVLWERGTGADDVYKAKNWNYLMKILSKIGNLKECEQALNSKVPGRGEWLAISRLGRSKNSNSMRNNVKDKTHRRQKIGEEWKGRWKKRNTKLFHQNKKKKIKKRQRKDKKSNRGLNTKNPPTLYLKKKLGGAWERVGRAFQSAKGVQGFPQKNSNMEFQLVWSKQKKPQRFPKLTSELGGWEVGQESSNKIGGG